VPGATVLAAALLAACGVAPAPPAPAPAAPVQSERRTTARTPPAEGVPSVRGASGAAFVVVADRQDAFTAISFDSIGLSAASGAELLVETADLAGCNDHAKTP